MKIRPIRQFTDSECGLCCVAMLMEARGRNVGIADIRDRYDVGRDGASLEDLQSIFQMYGIPADIWSVNDRLLRRMPEPLIAYWNNSHFVVIEEATKKGFVVIDPGSGRERISRAEFAEHYSGLVLEVQGVEDPLPPWQRWSGSLARSKRSWQPVLSALGSIPWMLVGAFVAAAVIFVLTATVPFITRHIVDTFIASRSLTGVRTPTLLLAVSAGIVCFVLVATLQARMLSSIAKRIGKHLSESAVGHLIRLPFKYFGSRPPGEILYRLNMLNMVRDRVSTLAVKLILDLLVVVLLLVVAAVVAGPVVWVLLAIVILDAALVLLSTRSLREATDTENTAAGEAVSKQLEGVLAIATLKVTGSEKIFMNGWRDINNSALEAMGKRVRIQGMLNGSLSAVQIASPVVILLIGAPWVTSNSTITLGSLVAAQSIANMCLTSLSSSLTNLAALFELNSMLEKASDIVATAPERTWGDDNAEHTGILKLENVSFRYADNAPMAVENISLTVRPGERVAIVGRTGSGKSTIGKLLCGLYEPNRGKVTFDDKDLRAYSRQGRAKVIGYVPQEVHLLHQSVLDNIGLGRGYSDEEIQAAAQIADIDSDIKAMPLGYSTVVAEMGGNFSGGQRQRLAIARAIISAPHVLLLDEATSAIDMATEHKIVDNLDGLNLAIVTIAHRAATVLKADRIVVLKQGRIVEQGTHAELMAMNGEYVAIFHASGGHDVARPRHPQPKHVVMPEDHWSNDSEPRPRRARERQPA